MAIFDMPGHLIRRLQQISTQSFQTHMKAAGFDMTSVQYAAMDALHNTPGIEQAEVATRIAYDRATIGGVIDRLEQKGWVKRVVSKRDRRAREVSLTEKGKAVYEEATPIVSDLQRDILKRLDDEEMEVFVSLLQKSVKSDT